MRFLTSAVCGLAALCLLAAGAFLPLVAATPAAAQTAQSTPEALVSSTRSSAFSPVAKQAFYLVVTGTGSATITAVFSGDGGSTYAPEATSVDGDAPIILGKVAYNGAVQNGLRIPLSVDRVGMRVAALPGTVTGAITVGFEQ